MARTVDADAPLNFSYEAIAPDGTRVKGPKAQMTAYSEDAVRRALLDEGYVPISITESKQMSWNVDFGQLAKNRPLKMKALETAAFARQLNQLLVAGIPVPKAVAALGEDAKDPRLTKVCNEIANKVAAGSTLSGAFADYPVTFDDIFVSYIAAGEETGSLIETTGRLAKMMEKRAALGLKIKSVTAYPKMVAAVIFLMVIGILAFLVPQYAGIYDSFGAELPAPTQALVSVSENILPFRAETLSGQIPVLGKFVFKPWTMRPNPISPFFWMSALYFGWRVFKKRTMDNDDVGIRLDRIKFRFPIFGKLNHTMTLFRWTSTLSGALASGVQTYAALDLAGRSSGSRWVKAITPQLKEALESGRPLSSVLPVHADLFPPNVRTMVSTGEAAGELADMLENVSNALDQEIDAIVAGLGAKIEVALLMILGGVVGTLLVILYLPILSLTTTVGDGLTEQHGG